MEYELNEAGLQKFCDEVLPLKDGYTDISTLDENDKQYLIGYMDAIGRVSPTKTFQLLDLEEYEDHTEYLTILDTMRVEIGEQVLTEATKALLYQMADIVTTMLDNKGFISV